MRSIMLAAIILATTTSASHARPVHLWSFDELARKADLVLIVSVAKPTERTGAQETFHGRKLDKVRTELKVHAVLKGNYDSANIELLHLAEPIEIDPHILFMDGWGFRWFSERDDMFLVFLIKSDDGKLAPVTGQEDLNISFVQIPPDGPTGLPKMYPELFKPTNSVPSHP